MKIRKGRVFHASLKLEVVRMIKEQGQSIQTVSDITYIRTGAGWLCLATVLDLYARKVAKAS